ncbi:MAG: PBECR2 nuclease fold domain-containing protein [Nanoarchaeota archaeon]
MVWIFEVIDKSGRKIHLSKERWVHINKEHPEVAPHLEDVEETLVSPLKVVQDKYDADVYYYYKYFKRRQSYLLVIVKYLNGEGFVITVYFVRNIR